MTKHRTRRVKQNPGNTALTQVLSRLNDELKRAAGDDPTAIAIAEHAHKGIKYASRNEWSKAAAEFSQLAFLSAEADDPAAEARAYYSQGMALFYLTNRQNEAQIVFERALALAKETDQSILAAKIHFILSTYRMTTGDIAQVMSELNQAFDLADAEQEPELVAQILQGRASIYQLQFQFAKAERDLTQALKVAKRSSNVELRQSIEHDRILLKHYTKNGQFATPTSDMLRSLQKLAKKYNDEGLGLFVELDRGLKALLDKKPKRALQIGQEAQQSALVATDSARYMRYIMASLLMAQAHDQLENRIDVLRVLLTCKKTLEVALGETAGQLIVPILDGLQTRWGSEALQETFNAYMTEAQAEMAGPS
ncbi:MAG: hypothetical protein AAF485_10750 [Chloroflexota bacterium]